MEHFFNGTLIRAGRVAMSRKDLSRRDFNKLSVAALGGALSGALFSSCKSEGDKDGSGGPGDVHVCRGLNTCKGKGAGGGNECAGTGACATAKAHGCNGHNECKGQGGCGANPGANECSGKGACAVPLDETAWKKARAAFEANMNAEGKDIGDAPNE